MPLVCNTRSVTDQFDCYEGDSTMREIEEVVLYQIRKHIKEVLALDLLTGQEMMNYPDQINRNKEEYPRHMSIWRLAMKMQTPGAEA